MGQKGQDIMDEVVFAAVVSDRRFHRLHFRTGVFALVALERWGSIRGSSCDGLCPAILYPETTTKSGNYVRTKKAARPCTVRLRKVLRIL